MARRLLRLRGTVTTSEVISRAYARRLLLGHERRHNWFALACRCALESVGAVRIGRAPTIGRPCIWAMPQSGASGMPPKA
jgi:hypothetical protein